MIASTSDFPVRRQSIWVIVLLEIVTVGVYGPYWFLSRRSGFHSLSSEQRLPEVALSLVLVAAIVSAVLTVVLFFLSDLSSIVAIFQVVQVLDLAIGVSLLFFAFRVRGILQDHLAGQGVGEAGISGFWTFFLNLVYLQYKINHIPQQLAEVDESIRDESLAEQHFERGLELGDERRWREAIAEFDAAISLKPDHVSAHAQRGFGYAELGEFDRAIADYNRAIEMVPDEDTYGFSVYNNRGLAHAEIGNKEQAFADLEKAISLTRDPAIIADLEDTVKELRERR